MPRHLSSPPPTAGLGRIGSEFPRRGTQQSKRECVRPHNTQRRTDTHYAWGVCGLLLLAIGLIYGQTLDHVLLGYDDSVFVFANPACHAGPDRRGSPLGFHRRAVRRVVSAGPAVAHARLPALRLNAWGHHLTNVLLHAAASIALFLVLWRMTGELWPSAFVAAVFAVHPQHVESVAWVAERRDVLSGLFFMLTLAA